MQGSFSVIFKSCKRFHNGSCVLCFPRTRQKRRSASFMTELDWVAAILSAGSSAACQVAFFTHKTLSQDKHAASRECVSYGRGCCRKKNKTKHKTEKNKSHQNVFHAHVMKFAPSTTSLIFQAKFHCRGGINDAIVMKELGASDADRQEGRWSGAWTGLIWPAAVGPGRVNVFQAARSNLVFVIKFIRQIRSLTPTRDFFFFPCYFPGTPAAHSESGKQSLMKSRQR